MILFIVVFCMLVALGFGIAAAIADFRSMNIPNIYSIGIAIAFVIAYAADAATGEGVEFFSGWQSHLIAAGIVFGVTFVLFLLKIIGAGDSKLLSAFALWVATPGLAAFVFYTALLGAVLGIATKILNKKTIKPDAPAGSWIARAQGGYQGVPYGIAIAFGAFCAFYGVGYLSPSALALLAGGGTH